MSGQSSHARNDWLFAIVALALLIAIIASHRYSPPQLSPTAIWLLHSLHAPGFAVVASIALWIFKKKGHGTASYWLACAVTMGAAVLAEVSQIPGPRDAQFGDLVVDATGIAAALGTAALFDRRLRQWISWRWLPLVASLSLAALFFTTKTSIGLSIALFGRSNALPALLTVEHRWESYLYPESRKGTATVVTKPDAWPGGNGDFVLRAEATGRWDILIHVFPYPH